jgi:hypothetical protein
MRRLLEHFNFPKIFTILAFTFGVALGACGLTVLASGTAGGGRLMELAIFEMGVMVLSLAGLFVVLILWLLAAILGVRRHEDMP